MLCLHTLGHRLSNHVRSILEVPRDIAFGFGFALFWLGLTCFRMTCYIRWHWGCILLCRPFTTWNFSRRRILDSGILCPCDYDRTGAYICILCDEIICYFFFSLSPYLVRFYGFFLSQKNRGRRRFTGLWLFLFLL